jgi:polygalacturonase
MEAMVILYSAFICPNLTLHAGLSIGSVGGRSDNTVKTVTISGSTIKNSQNGVRIKTVSGATGSVSGVTYKSITLSNISKYGIVIEQDYEVSPEAPTAKSQRKEY